MNKLPQIKSKIQYKTHLYCIIFQLITLESFCQKPFIGSKFVINHTTINFTMNTHFTDFLDRHYFEEEKNFITAILNKFNWYQLLEIRFNHIIENESPDVATIGITIIQSINDKLRILNDQEEKLKLEGLLAGLFRNILGDLCQKKENFHESIPDMVLKIKATYELNGDNFSELARLINFQQFTQNIEFATPGPKLRTTTHLKWNHENISADHVCQCMRYHSLITEQSRFTDLFIKSDTRIILVPKKQRKRFALAINKLLTNGFMSSVGSKSTYQFIEENVQIAETSDRFTDGYMRRTVNNTKNGTGFDRHEKLLNSFMGDIGLKDGQLEN